MNAVELEETLNLWRYMDLSKFISLIGEKALWLARADTFRDKHEGRFPDDMRIAIEKAYANLGSNKNFLVKDADDFQDYLQKNTFISCWHKNFDENMVMWAIYGRDNNALAIQTTVKRIMDSVVDTSKLSGYSLILKSVSYQRPEEISSELRYEDCFFIKRPHFRFEDEVRICLDTYFPENPSKTTPYGHYLPVCINGLIERILIHPDSPKWYEDAIKSIKKEYKIKAPIEVGRYGNN